MALWHLYTFIYFTEDSPDKDWSRQISNKFFRSNKDYNCAGWKKFIILWYTFI